MTERRTKLLRIEHQQKFKSIKIAEKEAEAIRAFLSRNHYKNDWYFELLICVSEHDPRNSLPLLIRNGKRGRPSKMFIPNEEGGVIKKKKPHLHILLNGNPGQTIANMVVSNINKRFRKKNPKSVKRVVSRSFPFTEKYITYFFEQGSKLRRIKYDPEGLLGDFDFIRN